jgi:glycosyltransferase involved in cell wall biosynthesis
MKSEVSVVIPFYNRSEFLERLLKSIQSQTLIPDEVYVIDNGSTLAETEKALEIIEELSTSSFNITYISTLKRGNANYARNLGIHISESKYIAFLDSDDWWDSRHIELSMCKLRDSSRAAIYSGAIVHKLRTQKIKSDDVNKHLSPIDFLFTHRQMAQTSSYIINKEKTNGVLWDESLKRHQDYDFFLNIFYHSPGWEFSPEPATHVDWIEGGARKNLNFKSMIKFLKKWEPFFSSQALENYLLEQILFCSRLNASSIYFNYYKKKLIKTSGLSPIPIIKASSIYLKSRKKVATLARKIITHLSQNKKTKP